METHGIFDIDSMLIYFISEDNKHCNSENADILHDYIESAYASRNLQTYTLKHLLALEQDKSINLFHELVHSWQALSSPMIILTFLNQSKKLRANAKKLNLNPKRLSDTYLGLEDDDPNIDYLYKSHRMNFIKRKNGRIIFKLIKSAYNEWQSNGNNNNWFEFTRALKEKLEKTSNKDIYEILTYDLNIKPGSRNIVSEYPPLAMPLLEYDHEQEGKIFVGYAGLIDYFDLVYFTGDNLMEAFATINDYLKKGEKIPSYNPLNAEDNMYLGIYEVYRRMHGYRYDNEKELALSFLALVDLAFMTDSFGLHDEIYEYDISFHKENVSLPYRFGSIIYKAQGFHTFKITDNDVAKSLKNWQDSYCRYLGYFNPDDGIRNMVTAILSTIIKDGCSKYKFPNIDKIIIIIQKMLFNDESWNECLQYLLDETNNMYQHLNGAKITCHHHLLVMIVNALLFKLANRGEMIAPCYYSNLIMKSLESLLFIYNGEYYSMPIDNYSNMPLKQPDIGHYSLLDLMVLKPLAAEGVKNCGFLSSFIKCRFQLNGLGCPLLGLSNKEKERRLSIGMDLNWCHYKCVMNELDNAENK